jgi:hypothetical protein
MKGIKMEIIGDLDIKKGDKTDYSALTKVSGSVYVHEGATFNAPALTKAGYVVVREGATFKVPALAEVSGYVYVREGATFKVPELATIGHLTYNTEMFGYKIEVYDGLGSVTVSQKEKGGIKIRSCRKASFKDRILVGDKLYIVSDENNHAHGKTIKKALNDLAFKEMSENVDQFRGMDKATEKTVAEWALIYRAITRSCEEGIKMFIKEQGVLKDKYNLTEILEITNGAYRHDIFKEVVG